MQEDRRREIAAENYSLMQRLAGIMKEERGDPVQKFSHLSVEYRESLRRKKLLKLEVRFTRHIDGVSPGTAVILCFKSGSCATYHSTAPGYRGYVWKPTDLR